MLAEQLVQQPDPKLNIAYTMRVGFAMKSVKKVISSAWHNWPAGPGRGCPLEQLLASREDGQNFTVQPLPKVGTGKCVKTVSLNTQALLGNQVDGSSNSGEGGGGGVGSVGSSPPAQPPTQPGPSAGCHVCGAQQVQQGVSQLLAQPGLSGSIADIMAAARAAAVAAYYQLLAQQQAQQPA